MNGLLSLPTEGESKRPISDKDGEAAAADLAA